MISLSVSRPLLSSASLIISPKNTSNESSSLSPEMSILSSTHSPFPTLLRAAFWPPSLSVSIASPSSRPFSSASKEDRPPIVFSTSALTPTIASLPSLKLRCALPFAVGSTSVSAVRGRNCVGERESGRIGGVAAKEVRR